MSTCSLIKFYTNDVSLGERWGPFAVPRRPPLCVCAVVVNCARTCAHSHLPVSLGCVCTCRCARVHLFPHLISNEQLLIASPSCGGARRQRLRLSQPVNNYSARLVESLAAKGSRKIHWNLCKSMTSARILPGFAFPTATCVHENHRWLPQWVNVNAENYSFVIG